MATDNPYRLSEKSQLSLVSYVKWGLDEYRKRTDFINKMEVIDIAYARYKISQEQESGVDASAANTACGTLEDIEAPIVISQVDSMVGYAADVYCSGYPMFPVVSAPDNKLEAEKLQAIIDTHAILGGYQRQFVKFFRNAFKYNKAAIEADWAPIDRYSVLDDYMKPLDPTQVKKTSEHYTKLKNLDMYNAIYDPRVLECSDIPVDGEFAGWVDLFTRIQLIRYLQHLATTGYGYNTTQALHTAIGASTSKPIDGYAGLYYREKPVISKYIANRSMRDLYDFDWTRYMSGKPQGDVQRPVKGMYEICRLYARIIPREHGITAPNHDVPQIWKLEVINCDKLICAKRIISAYDQLPVFFAKPFEDDFGDQTQSAGENQIPWQDSVSKLINIRFHSARRAVADRAIYDPKMIDISDANNPHPAAKLPLKPNARLGGKSLDDAYKSIEYRETGLQGVMQDAQTMYSMSGQTSGLNKPQQGEFQKGNKSVQEWNDTMAGSDNRLRLPILVMQYQVILPIKEQIKLNIFQYGPTGAFQNVKDGYPVNITPDDITKLRNTVLQFQIADGYLPVSKIAAVDVMKEALILIGNSPILQTALGAKLPPMFEHIMSLQGVKGFDKYMPTQQEAQTNLDAAAAAQQPGAGGAQ